MNSLNPTTRLFLSSPSDVTNEYELARQVLEKLPKDSLLACDIRFNVVSWNDPGRRFLAAVDTARFGNSSRVIAGWEDAPGGMGRTL